jgi:DNA-binding XRE family transcriptional regulator
MGKPGAVKSYFSPKRALMAKLPRGLVRRRPRRFPEWMALREWGRIPPWETEPVGYLMRLARERTGLTQADLARLLGCSQQAIAQAERWESNPTVEFIRKWAAACGSKARIELTMVTKPPNPNSLPRGEGEDPGS